MSELACRTSPSQVGAISQIVESQISLSNLLKGSGTDESYIASNNPIVQDLVFALNIYLMTGDKAELSNIRISLSKLNPDDETTKIVLTNLRKILSENISLVSLCDRIEDVYGLLEKNNFLLPNNGSNKKDESCTTYHLEVASVNGGIGFLDSNLGGVAGFAFGGGCEFWGVRGGWEGWFKEKDNHTNSLYLLSLSPYISSSVSDLIVVQGGMVLGGGVKGNDFKGDPALSGFILGGALHVRLYGDQRVGHDTFKVPIIDLSAKAFVDPSNGSIMTVIGLGFPLGNLLIAKITE